MLANDVFACFYKVFAPYVNIKLFEPIIPKEAAQQVIPCKPLPFDI